MGAIAIVDPDAYSTFVSAEWETDDLDEHFRVEMAAKRLLIWETGMEATWRVQVHLSEVSLHGFREVTGPIIASQGRLLLTSYSSLSMAAQFPDITLPESHEVNRLLTLAPGEYRCRIIHMHNRDLITVAGERVAEVNYHVAIVPSTSMLPVWVEPPWASHVLRQWSASDSKQDP